jgi:hypothetical protein
MTAAALVFLVVFGAYYAWREYKRPLYPTWLAVVVGTGATLIGITIWLLGTLDRTDAIIAAAIMWAGFAITGGPMALAQAIKEQSFADEAQRRDRTTGRLDSDKEETNTSAF